MEKDTKTSSKAVKAPAKADKKPAEKTTKSSSSPATKTVSSTVTKKKNSSGMHSLILSLIVVQLLVIFFLGFVISEQDTKITNIEEKVTAIDGFFANNVPGYADGTVAPPENNGGQAQAPEVVELSDLEIEGEPTLGDANAPVTIVEFSDYECPFCAKFFTESHAKIKEEYIDKGLVRLVFKDFPLGFHELAVPAAVTANCVFKELGDEKYFEMHDKIFSSQRSLSVENLIAWATEIGADEDKLTTCMQDEEMSAEVQQDLQTGSKLGVSGTPSFFINGNLVVGAQPYSVIKAAIDAELAALE